MDAGAVERLIHEVRRQGSARASELRTALGVSQPTISRLIAQAGERICRTGAGPKVRYRLTRSIATLGTRLPLYKVDESGAIHRYGTLHLLEGEHQWLEPEKGPGQFFEGLPPFAVEMSPQGYIGRAFTRRYPELEVPRRTADWRDDHRLIALARRGEDCTGNLILGEESLDRFLRWMPQAVSPQDYPELARASLAGQPGSSAGGEQPKFGTYAEGRHVLVKFSSDDESAAARRWRDLLLSEHFALEAVRAEGIPTAVSRPWSIAGRQFLEVERFDRIGPRGRRALLSLRVIDDEYIGRQDVRTWTKAAEHLLAERRISTEDARTIRWLDVFGQLIANTDQHFGNLSFFVEEGGQFRLAPVYDMLPMLFAPVETEIIERPFSPAPPTAATLDVWASAARRAVSYWDRLIGVRELSAGFREHCRHCLSSVELLMRQFPGA